MVPGQLIALDRSGAVSIRRQIVDQVIRAIRAGALVHGQALPSSRALADQLDVARSTVTSSYLELEGEGWVEPVPGSGTFVSNRRLTPSPALDAGTGLSTEPAGTVSFDLRTGRVDPDLVAGRAWRAAWHEVRASSYPSPPAGEPDLLRHLAGYLRSAYGIDTAGDDLMVCAGIGEALLLLGLGLGWAGRTVAVEDPCYWQVRAVLTRLGVRVRPVDAGDPDAFVTTLTTLSPPPVAAYLTPNHQYPLGHRLGDEHRARLLEWADRTGCLIVEDDYNSEYRFGAPPPDTLSSGTSTAPVVYFGTMSKTLDPGLRLAYLRLPASVVDAVGAARSDIGTTTSRTTQLVVARLLRSGEVSRHSARLRRIYGDRRQAMLRCLAELPAVRAIRGGDAGLHVVAELCPDIDADRLVEDAARRGVLLNSLDHYRAVPNPACPALVLGFARLRPADLRTAVSVLRETVPRTGSRA